MKKMFIGFYNPPEEALTEIWGVEDTIFVFDTNVLLNLYSYAENTRKDFFQLLEKLSDRVWLPYYVGLEYQRRRLEIIRDEKAVFNKIDKNLDKIKSILTNDFNELSLQRRLPDLFEKTKELEKDIVDNIKKYKRVVDRYDKKQPCVRSHDEIREKIDSIFKNKVGDKPNSQDWLDKIYEEGKDRYQLKIPPGFMDKKKGEENSSIIVYENMKYERQYGDLIIWKQIIEYAKSDNINNVILITDDAKEDWWYFLDSRGKKQIGPHSYLINEIIQESQVNNFYMYNTSSFLDSGNRIYNLEINKSSIQDAEIIFDEVRSNKNRQLKLLIEERSNAGHRIYTAKRNLEKLVSRIFSTEMFIKDNVEIVEVIALFDSFFDEFPSFERDVFLYKYGNYFSRVKPYSIVCKHFDIEMEEVRDIIAKIHRRLRHPKRARLIKELFYSSEI